MPPTADPVPPPSPIARRAPSQLRRAVLAGLLGLGVAVALLLAALAIDATWLRPLIQQHILEKSGRRVHFDALHLGLDRALQPTVRMRGLVVQNAPWADPRPLVRAAEFGFTVAWESLRGNPVVLTRIEIVDGELDMERQADGLRNWRLTRPDDRGPGRVRVMSIEVRNTRARVVDGGIGLELALQATPLAQPALLAGHPDLPLTQRVVLHGTRHGTAFDAQVEVSDELTFVDTGRPFALRGRLQAGPAAASRPSAEVEGTLTDLLPLARLDLSLRLAGPRLADLGRVLGLTLALPPRPAQARGQLSKDGDHWQLSALQARWGRSELAGEARLDTRAPGDGRSMLQATLTSTRIDLADLREASPAAAPGPAPAALPTAPLDADIGLSLATLDGLPVAGPVTQLQARAVRRDGRWRIEPLTFSIAGGRGAGTLAADTAREPPGYALDLRLQGLQIERLARAVPRLPPLSGALDLRLALQSQGDTRASLAGALAGTLGAELVGAAIPAALEARLALDGGRVLRGVFGDAGARSAVTCSTLELRFEKGRGVARRLALETPHVALTGSGWVDLGQRRVDLVLTPRRKQAALLALDRSMQVRGGFDAPQLSLVDPGAVPAGAACVRGSAHEAVVSVR